MKTVDVYGLGNALVDILVKVTDQEFSSLDLEKATMRLVDAASQSDLLKRLGKHDLHMCSAGSVANSIYCLGQLGARAAFSGSVGDDRYGLFYKSEFEGLKILFPNAPTVGETTGTCLVFVTPDAERTMRTCLAVSSEFSSDHIDEEVIKSSKWVFVEGYLLCNPDRPNSWVPRLIELCAKHGTKIAFTCSEAWVVETQRDLVNRIVSAASLVFANESEALAISGESNIQAAFAKLKSRVPGVAITAGEKGALVAFDEVEGHVPAEPCTPVDLTGAGDAFAGAFLYGITHEVNPIEAARAGCVIASKVISHVGARFPGDLRAIWQDSFEAR